VTLHPALLAEMLNDEAAAARARHGRKVESIEVAGPDILCRVGSSNIGTATLRFAGATYDAEPFQVAVVTDDGAIAPQGMWPAGLFHSVHPILQRGFICIRGTYEYHCHPQHVTDTWASHRQALRLPQLLGHILKRMGQ
jgi:hypothetical protein